MRTDYHPLAQVLSAFPPLQTYCLRKADPQESRRMGLPAFLGLCLLGYLILHPGVEGAENDTVAGRARCPAGALFYKQFCYQFVNSYVSWPLAEVNCQGLGSGLETHLVSILSAKEGKIVASYLNSKGASDIWIGLEATRSNGYMVWEWSDVSPVTLPLWDGRSLSNVISGQECVSMTNIRNTISQKWQQRYCSDTLPYLCKFRADY